MKNIAVRRKRFKTFFLTCSVLCSVPMLVSAQWAFKIGGEGYETCNSMVVDQNNTLYVAGNFTDPLSDFDPGSSEVLLNHAGEDDIFVAAYAAQGDLIWAFSVGGNGREIVNSIDLDREGNIYISGWFSSDEADFDPGSAVASISAGSSENSMFVASYNPEGHLRWVFDIQGSDGGRVNAYDVHIDQESYVWVTGTIMDIEVDFDPGPEIKTLEGVLSWEDWAYNTSMFVARYDNQGNYVSAVAIGKAKSDVSGQGIVTDNSGNVYVVGYFWGNEIDFDPGPEIYKLSSTGKADAFVLKLNEMNTLDWAYPIGGVDNDLASSLLIAEDSILYVLGYYNGSADFDPSINEDIQTSLGSEDIFILKMNTQKEYLGTASLGSTGPDRSLRLSSDNNGNILLAGYYTSAENDFDPGSAVLTLPYLHSNDMFFGMLSQNLETVWMESVNSESSIAGYLMIPLDDAYVVSGQFSGWNIDVDPTENVTELSCNTPSGESDLFFASYNTPSQVNEKKSFSDDNGGFRIYPNPFASDIFINESEKKDWGLVKIYDINGNIVFEDESYLEKSIEKLNKSISFYKKGFYVFTFKSDQLIVKQRMIKK